MGGMELILQTIMLILQYVIPILAISEILIPSVPMEHHHTTAEQLD